MTETTEAALVAQAIELIDRGLSDLKNRELMSSGEVSDLLLDLRMLLTFYAAETTPVS